MRNHSKGTYFAHMIILAALSAAVLLPFADKALHIDDTLFIWTAKQIINRPWDFYGFNGNWDGTFAPAPEIIKNPPIGAYYLALVGWLGGFSERVLHTAFIFPAFMALWGTYAAARRMCTLPLLAALLALATPAFLVSSTTLMCDVLMLAFWAWAVFFWIKGVEDNSRLSLLLSAVLIALSALTKYFGISLIPLLAAYSILKGRKGLSSLPFLLIPVAALAGYHFYTQMLYGRGLLLDASQYATKIQSGGEQLDRALIGIVFTGGCLIAALFFLLPVFGIKGIIAGMALTAAGAVYLVSRTTFGAVELWTGDFGWDYAIQLAVYAAAGIGIFLLMIVDLIRRRDAFSVLLALWVVGTFAFTVFFNWTVNARSILPMAPAVGMLLARAAEEESLSRMRKWAPFVLALAFSMAIAWADYRLANSARNMARSIADKYSVGPGQLWFQGHWGFQYYMEERGAKPIEWRNMQINEGDTVAFPFNNTGLRLLSEDKFEVVEDMSFDPSPFVSTMTLGPGAGFYASEWGPLPFMLMPPNGERYQILKPIPQITEMPVE